MTDIADEAASGPCCPDCGGAFTEGPLCSYCGKGLRFAGEGFVFQESQVTCPLCRVALHQIDYHGVAIDTCSTCEGAWFDLGEIRADPPGGTSGRQGGPLRPHPHRRRPRASSPRRGTGPTSPAPGAAP